MKVARAVAQTFAVAGLVVLIWPSGSRAQTPSANVSVFATGLDNPRGLKFGPDGELYVAEGGAAGTALDDRSVRPSSGAGGTVYRRIYVEDFKD